MIRYDSRRVMLFICDWCRTEAPGFVVPTKTTGTGITVEPEGWLKIVRHRRPGDTTIRHACPECQEKRGAR